MPGLDLTFVVTIDPVKSLAHLDTLVHSLNLQTRRTFAVVFWNQTRLREREILASLTVTPAFPYLWRDLDRARFFGRYPLWDLYQAHDALLREGWLGAYVMSLHMEEFLDVDYVEQAAALLERHPFDILFGNLRRTRATVDDVRPIRGAATPADFTAYLRRTGLDRSPHWSFRSERARWWTLSFLRTLAARRRAAGKGYFVPSAYRHEDVYFMRRSFAERFNWFLRGHAMPFEDIHICEQPGVCELGRELRRLTTFPAYFVGSRIYHLAHDRYYYQLLDPEFTDGVLRLESDDPIVVSLQRAITRLRSGEFTVSQALRWTRQNADRMGTQDMNYRYHMQYLGTGTDAR